jgi:hypothetical protein
MPLTDSRPSSYGDSVADKAREAWLRRITQHQGLTLTKSRWRDPRATDTGAMGLSMPHAMTQ